MNVEPSLYRPALRGLFFGLTALALRLATVGFMAWAMARSGPGSPPAPTVAMLWTALPFVSLFVTLVALVGVGYSAIAAHRREWSAALVLAFASSVGAVLLDLQLFVYVIP